MATSASAALQQLGLALLLPIAVLPVASLLLRLGQPDLLAIPLMAQAGDAVFTHLALLFAVAVAVGFARDHHGVAGLAGAVGHCVFVSAMKAIDPVIDMGVLAGLLSGVVSGQLYNRCGAIRLPAWLDIFGGKHFVPIAAGGAALVLAVVFGYLWPPIQYGVGVVGQWLIGAGEAGLFFYGFLSRVLLVTGLHHILDEVVGSVRGGLVPGTLMTGLFPVVMFGLPAACLAVYRHARPENRAAVGGVLWVMGLGTFLSGVTEPLEFAVLFLAPMLFGIHAVLTGVALTLMHVLGVRAGSSFSGGAFDLALSFSSVSAANAWLILPVGLLLFALYYGLFSFCIRRFDLRTPGRGAAATNMVRAAAEAPMAITRSAFGVQGPEPLPPMVGRGRASAIVREFLATRAARASRAGGFVAALGGPRNLRSVDACATRLRLEVVDNRLVRESELKALGALGVIQVAPGSLQVVLGPIADTVAEEIRGVLRTAAA